MFSLKNGIIAVSYRQDNYLLANFTTDLSVELVTMKGSLFGSLCYKWVLTP